MNRKILGESLWRWLLFEFPMMLLLTCLWGFTLPNFLASFTGVVIGVALTWWVRKWYIKRGYPA